MSETEFVGIPTERIPLVWPLVASMIGNACEENPSSGYWPEDIRSALTSGEMNLCMAADEDGPRAICISEVVQRPHAKVWRILLCMGEGRKDWLPFVKFIEETARRIDCRWCESVAREGWSRELKPYGYKKTHVLLVKDLSDA